MRWEFALHRFSVTRFVRAFDGGGGQTTWMGPKSAGQLWARGSQRYGYGMWMSLKPGEAMGARRMMAAFGARWPTY